jgi:hypothetical protein
MPSGTGFQRTDHEAAPLRSRLSDSASGPPPNLGPPRPILLAAKQMICNNECSSYFAVATCCDNRTEVRLHTMVQSDGVLLPQAGRGQARIPRHIV